MQILSLTSRMTQNRLGVRTVDALADARETETRRLAREPAVRLAGLLAGMTDEAGKERLAARVKEFVAADKLTRDLAANAKSVRKSERADKVKELQERLKALQMQVTIAKLHGDKRQLKAIASEAARLAQQLKGMIRDAGGDVPSVAGGEPEADVDPEAFSREVVGLPQSAAPAEAKAEQGEGGSEATMDDAEWKRVLHSLLEIVRSIHRQARNALPRGERNRSADGLDITV